MQIEWYKKYTLSVQETSAYFGISTDKIRKIISENEQANFILWNGSRPRIKKKLFEIYIDNLDTI